MSSLSEAIRTIAYKVSSGLDQRCGCLQTLPPCLPDAPPAATLPPQVRTASCAGTACVNSFGDEQLAVDMVADKLLFDALRFSVRRERRMAR